MMYQQGQIAATTACSATRSGRSGRAGHWAGVRLAALAGCLAAAVWLAGCASDSNPTGDEHDHDHAALAWIWAYDGETRSLRAYDAEDGTLGARFTAVANPMMHMVAAGTADAPTLWMAGDNTAYAFTTGFRPHGDHAHMELPRVHLTVPVGPLPTHMGVSPDGRYVAFANDGDGTVSVIEASTGTVRALGHGSTHSAALLTGTQLLTTAATAADEAWARLVDLGTGEVAATLAIGHGAHGDAFHAASSTAFIACAGAIYVIDTEARVVRDSLVYTQSGRTNFLYHAGSSPHAVGLHRTSGDGSDKVLLLNMADRRLDYLTIPGAVLDWKIREGAFALSASGDVAVLADLRQPRLYHVQLASRVVTTLPAPAAAAAVAIHADGEHVWAYSAGRVTRYHVDDGAAEAAFDVDPSTDWIHVTSVTGEVMDDH